MGSLLRVADSLKWYSWYRRISWTQNFFPSLASLAAHNIKQINAQDCPKMARSLPVAFGGGGICIATRRALLAGGALLAFVGLIAATAEFSDRSDPVTIPDETAIHVTLDQGLSSDQNRSGDEFQATVSEPVVIDDQTVIPAGTHVTGLVVDARPSGYIVVRYKMFVLLCIQKGRVSLAKTSSTAENAVAPRC